MPEIQLPTKLMQDAIKQDTSEIKSDISTVGTELNSIRTTITDGLGTDWGEYTPFVSRLNKTPVLNVFEPLLEINGAGYLSKAIMRGVSSSTYRCDLKISIDGSLLYSGYVNALLNAVGVLTNDYIFLNSNSKFVAHAFDEILELNVMSFQFGGSPQPISYLLDQPLFFENHLLVEYKISNSVMSLPAKIEVRGGLK